MLVNEFFLTDVQPFAPRHIWTGASHQSTNEGCLSFHTWQYNGLVSICLEAHLLNTLRTFRILGRWQGRCWHCTFSQTLKVRASVISVIFLIFVTQTFMIFHVSLDINAPSLWDPATVQDGSDWSFSTWGYVLKMPFWMLAHWIFVQLSIQQSQCGFCPSIQKILEESS